MTRAKPPIEDEVADLMSWVSGAACTNHDPKLFDLPRKNQFQEYTTRARKRIEQAKEICADCPVMMRCLEHAATYDCKDAIYGGLDDDERAEWLDKVTAA